jgi:predicted MFS family arabinose efflux permease
MTDPALAFRDLARPAARATLPKNTAFYLQASIVVFFLAGSSAPTPLYARYQAEWGFSAITTTLIFGVYALAVLAALVVAGSLSDHVGRRPVLLAAIGGQVATMLVFDLADGVPALVLARVLQGLSTGAAVGAVGAGMLDLDKAKGTIANAVGPLTGTAAGSLGAGLLAQYLPAPTHLVYLVLLAIFVLQGVGVVFMSESATRRPGAVASLRPDFTLPETARAPFLVAVPALIAVWALVGFYGSLGPALVRVVAGSSSLLLGGLVLFVLAGSAVSAILLLRAARPRVMMVFGAIALFVGVGLTLVALSAGSVLLLFAGAIVAGAGFGGGFQGAVRTVVPLARAHERAGVLSNMYVVSYLALGLPAVLGGFLVVHTGGLVTTAREYAAAVMVLATLALVGALRSARPCAQAGRGARETREVTQPARPTSVPC